MSRQTAIRLTALATLRLTSTDQLALDDAEAYLSRALDEVRQVRGGPEHISTVLARALGALPRPGDVKDGG